MQFYYERFKILSVNWIYIVVYILKQKTPQKQKQGKKKSQTSQLVFWPDSSYK